MRELQLCEEPKIFDRKSEHNFTQTALYLRLFSNIVLNNFLFDIITFFLEALATCFHSQLTVPICIHNTSCPFCPLLAIIIIYVCILYSHAL